LVEEGWGGTERKCWEKTACAAKNTPGGEDSKTTTRKREEIYHAVERSGLKGRRGRGSARQHHWQRLAAEGFRQTVPVLGIPEYLGRSRLPTGGKGKSSNERGKKGRKKNNQKAKEEKE